MRKNDLYFKEQVSQTMRELKDFTYDYPRPNYDYLVEDKEPGFRSQSKELFRQDPAAERRKQLFKQLEFMSEVFKLALGPKVWVLEKAIEIVKYIIFHAPDAGDPRNDRKFTEEFARYEAAKTIVEYRNRQSGFGIDSDKYDFGLGDFSFDIDYENFERENEFEMEHAEMEHAETEHTERVEIDTWETRNYLP